MNPVDIRALDRIVKRHLPYQQGQHLFRAGDQSHALFVVRSGALKSYSTTEDGDEQVIGFTLPGELVGLDGMSDDAYASNSVVLRTATICELPYDKLEKLCHSLPGLNHQLMQLASKAITTNKRMQLILARSTAEEKLAAFLLSLPTCYLPGGRYSTEFILPMSRQDIGNYLGLAIETVSRLFTRFQEDGLFKVNRREVTITDLPRLKGMVHTARQAGFRNSRTSGHASAQ